MDMVNNALDVDMAALKKGEIDLGTSMYLCSHVFSLILLVWP